MKSLSKASLPVLLLLAAAILGMVSLHVYPLLHPWIFDDDFTLLTDAWDWATTRQNLWAPFNDNVCPMERLAPYGLVQVAGRITAFPRVASWQGPIALAVAMVLVYIFVKREMGHRFYGLVASIVFGCRSNTTKRSLGIPPASLP